MTLVKEEEEEVSVEDDKGRGEIEEGGGEGEGEEEDFAGIGDGAETVGAERGRGDGRGEAEATGEEAVRVKRDACRSKAKGARATEDDEEEGLGGTEEERGGGEIRFETSARGGIEEVRKNELGFEAAEDKGVVFARVNAVPLSCAGNQSPLSSLSFSSAVLTPSKVEITLMYLYVLPSPPRSCLLRYLSRMLATCLSLKLASETGAVGEGEEADDSCIDGKKGPMLQSEIASFSVQRLICPHESPVKRASSDGDQHMLVTARGAGAPSVAAAAFAVAVKPIASGKE